MNQYFGRDLNMVPVLYGSRPHSGMTKFEDDDDEKTVYLYVNDAKMSVKKAH